MVTAYRYIYHVSHSPVKLVLLLERVKKCTAARGKRSALAASLGVPKQRINEWLTFKHLPSGEMTLRLLEWVTTEEAIQQKTPAHVATTRKGKQTRKRKQANESKSGPSS